MSNANSDATTPKAAAATGCIPTPQLCKTTLECHRCELHTTVTKKRCALCFHDLCDQCLHWDWVEMWICWSCNTTELVTKKQCKDCTAMRDASCLNFWWGRVDTRGLSEEAEEKIMLEPLMWVRFRDSPL